MWKPVLAISLGAVSGALLRWPSRARVNTLDPSLPLIANLIGPYIVVLAVACFTLVPKLSPKSYSRIVTGSLRKTFAGLASRRLLRPT